MLSQDWYKLRRYCKDGIEKVENYNKAVSDTDTNLKRWALARIASN